MSKFIKFLTAVIITALLFSGCNKSEYTFTEVVYGEEKNQDMSIFVPENLTYDVPFVMMIHGGGWSAGEKEDFYDLCKGFTEKGYAAVSINYRLTGDGAKCSDMINDIRSALQYLKDNSAEYHIRTDKTALIGGSAGAHLSLLYGYKITDSPVPISFIVSMSGPADFTNPDYSTCNIENLIAAATGDSYNFTGEVPESWVDISPINYVTADSPYTIIGHGTDDSIVPYSEAQKLAAKLTECGVDYDFITFENSEHGLDNDAAASDKFYSLLEETAYSYLPIS